MRAWRLGLILTLAQASVGCVGSTEERPAEPEGAQAEPASGITPSERPAAPADAGLSTVPVVRLPPFVGTDDVDEHGYPLRHPDQTAIIGALRLRRFGELEQWLSYYQDSFESDYRKEAWPDDAISAFFIADPELASALDAWAESSPDAFAPWAARGNYRYKLGWEARGHAFANETSDAQFRRMREHHAAAAADFERALALRPGLVAASRRLLQIEAVGGADPERTRSLLDEATAACELCVEVRAVYLQNLTPRWGGSLDEMERFANDVMPLAWRNPKLGMLAGFADAERCREHRRAERFSEAHSACDRALTKGEAPDFLLEKARVLRDEGDHEAALRFLDRALSLAPHDREALALRSRSRSKTEDHLGAADDLIVVRQLDPTDDDVVERVDWMVKKLRYEGDQRYKAGAHTEAAAFFLRGLQLSPDDRDLFHRAVWNEKEAGVDALLGLLPGSPEDFALHLRADWGLAVDKRFGEVVTMWNGFIERNPEDARAYRERAGAKWQLGQAEPARQDMQRACDLGGVLACKDIQRMRR